MCDIDTPLNGLLLHSDTLCVLSYGGPEDPYEDAQEATQEDGQESSQYDEGEEEEMEKNSPGDGTTAGLSGTTAPGPDRPNQPHASGIGSGTAWYRERRKDQRPTSAATIATATCYRQTPPVGPLTRYRQRYQRRYWSVPGTWDA